MQVSQIHAEAPLWAIGQIYWNDHSNSLSIQMGDIDQIRMHFREPNKFSPDAAKQEERKLKIDFVREHFAEPQPVYAFVKAHGVQGVVFGDPLHPKVLWTSAASVPDLSSLINALCLIRDASSVYRLEVRQCVTSFSTKSMLKLSLR